MGRVKDMLIGMIEELSAKSGYDEEWLMDRWFDYCDECRSDGETADWDYFAGVTIAHDW